MRCPVCGNELNNGEAYCHNCGSPVNSNLFSEMGMNNSYSDDSETMVMDETEPDTTQLNTSQLNTSPLDYENQNQYQHQYMDQQYYSDDYSQDTMLQTPGDDNGYYGGQGSYSGGDGFYSGGNGAYSGGGGSYSDGNGFYSGGNGSYDGGNRAYSGDGYYSGGDSFNNIPQDDFGGKKKKKRKKTWIVWTIVAAIIIAGLGGGAWFYLSRIRGIDGPIAGGSEPLDTSGYVKAEQSFIDFSDFYNGYALVTYFRTENDPKSLTASLINKKGQLCPIKDGNRTINGIEIEKFIQFFPIQKSGLLIFSESTRQNAAGSRDTRMLVIDGERNMVSINEKGYTFDDFLGTGEECILMRKQTTDKTGISAFNLLDLSGEQVKSFEVKAELQHATWSIDARCAINGQFFILNSNTGNKYIISKDNARLVNPREETFPAASADDKMIALLDCTKIQDEKYKTIILTEKGEPKEVIGNTDYSKAGAVYNGYFYNPTQTDSFTDAAIVTLKNGHLENTKLDFKSHFDTENKDNILCGFSGDNVFITAYNSLAKGDAPQWHTYQFDLNGKQVSTVVNGYLTHVPNIQQREIYYLNNTKNYSLRFLEKDYPVVIERGGNTVTFYDEKGNRKFESQEYQYVYQFTDSVARAVPVGLKNGEDGYQSDKAIDYSNSDDLFTFRQDKIVYLTNNGKKLFESITFPSNY